MKHINKVGIFALSAAFITVPALSAMAMGGGMTMDGFASGYDYGQHVSDMAQAGYLGADMNPGTHHQGYSPWSMGR